jgi:hypothetical protein
MVDGRCQETKPPPIALMRVNVMGPVFLGSGSSNGLIQQTQTVNLKIDGRKQRHRDVPMNLGTLKAYKICKELDGRWPRKLLK